MDGGRRRRKKRKGGGGSRGESMKEGSQLQVALAFIYESDFPTNFMDLLLIQPARSEGNVRYQQHTRMNPSPFAVTLNQSGHGTTSQLPRVSALLNRRPIICDL